MRHHRAVNPARRGSFIAATWLIGLGLVFLIREAADLSWAEAWPMFIILGGVGGFVSRAVRGGFRLVDAPWTFTGPIFWTIVGVILLQSTTGGLGQGPVELIEEWWPWLAVALGIWYLVGAIVPRGRPTETLALPLAGAIEAAVRIRFGAGELTTRTAAPGNLVDGTYLGGVVTRGLGAGHVELEQDTTYGLPWLDRKSTWTVGLTGAVPLDLRLDVGASRNLLDLRDLRVRNLEIHTGAAEAGAASLVFEVPSGVAARIRTRVALGSVRVDEVRFPRAAGGYESADYATAPNRIDIDVQGGVGSLQVISAE
jgi:hypothetical protein